MIKELPAVLPWRRGLLPWLLTCGVTPVSSHAAKTIILVLSSHDVSVV